MKRTLVAVPAASGTMLVVEQQEKHESQWAAIASIARKMGCTPETLRKWVRQMERVSGSALA